MAPKSKPAKASAKESKEPKAAKSAKAEKAGKPEKKSAKASEDEIVVDDTEGAPTEPAVDLEELEEAAAEAATSGGGGNEAALAAATSSTEMSASFKNFRHHPDMENFYRFIYENDLRHEALAIIEEISVEKAAKRAASVKPAKGAH